MGFADGAGDGQAEAEAVGLGDHDVVGLLEILEDHFLQIFGDAGAGVLEKDFEAGPAAEVARFGVDAHRAAADVELDRVVQQRNDRLAVMRLIGERDAGERIGVELNRHFLGDGARREIVGALADQFP